MLKHKNEQFPVALLLANGNIMLLSGSGGTLTIHKRNIKHNHFKTSFLMSIQERCYNIPLSYTGCVHDREEYNKEHLVNPVSYK